MRSNLMKWLSAILAACSLCAANLYAQKNEPRAKPQDGIPTAESVRYIRVDTVGDSARYVVSYPALRDNDDYKAVGSDDQDAFVQKLACFSPTEIMQLVANTNAYATAESWNQLMRQHPQCNADVGPVSYSGLRVLLKRPWYDPAGMYKRSTLAGNDPSTRYAFEGFHGDADVLAQQMKQTFSWKVPVKLDTAGNPTEFKTVELSVPEWYYQYATGRMADSATVRDVIELASNEGCEIVPLPAGMPFAYNTGRGIVGLNRVLDPNATGPSMLPLEGGELRAAACRTRSGRVVYILERCTNIAYPLMGVEYTFYVRRRKSAPKVARITISKMVQDATDATKWRKVRDLGDARNEARYLYRVVVKNVGDTTAVQVRTEDRSGSHLNILAGPLQTPGVANIAPGDSLTFMVNAQYIGIDQSERDRYKDKVEFWNFAQAKGQNTNLAIDSALVYAGFPKQGGGGFFCKKNALTVAACLCATAEVIGLITEGKNICGIPLRARAANAACVPGGNKPCDGPDPRYDLAPVFGQRFGVGMVQQPGQKRRFIFGIHVQQ